MSINILKIFKNLIFAKWTFEKPNKKNILIYDRVSESFSRYLFPRKSYEILDCRYESINIYILCMTFLKSGIINFKDNYKKNFIQNNIVGVYNLLENFKKFSEKNKKTCFVHISTDEVYGDILKGRSGEDYPYKPSSPYAASKASSDHLVYSYIRTYKIPAMITNCSNNYGPKQHPEKLIPKLIYNILNNKKLPIYGNGKNSREWIYVKDHCEALIKVFQKGSKGEFYNIGSNINLNNIEISKTLLNISKKK